MKALMILSTFLNLVVFGLIGLFAFMMEDDAKYFVDYVQMDEEHKKVAREYIQISNAIPEDVALEFEKIAEAAKEELKDREFNDIMAALDTPEKVQKLLVSATRTTIANNEERLREEQASIERFEMLRSEYKDFEARLAMERAAVERDQKDFEERKNEWQQIETNSSLDLLIQRLNKAKKAEDFLDQVIDRPVKEQVYILSQIKKPESVAAVFNGLPADQQRAIKDEQSNPLNDPSGGVGVQ